MARATPKEAADQSFRALILASHARNVVRINITRRSRPRNTRARTFEEAGRTGNGQRPAGFPGSAAECSPPLPRSPPLFPPPLPRSRG